MAVRISNLYNCAFLYIMADAVQFFAVNVNLTNMDNLFSNDI